MSGYKQWAPLEVLTNADLNGYLMSQSVPRFPDTTARDAAIGTLENGQLCWVDGIGLMQWDSVGDQWISVAHSLGRADGVFDVTEYGAVGDDATDCSAAIQAAIDAAHPVKGVVFFPPGIFRVVTTLTLKNGVELRSNGGRVAVHTAQIKSVSGDIFTNTSTLTGAKINGLYLRSAAGGGHIFNFAANLSQCEFRNCYMRQDNDGKSICHVANTFDMVECSWTWLSTQHTLTATVPTWNIVGFATLNIFERIRHHYSGDYVFHLEATDLAGYMQDNLFSLINFEICHGGEIRILSGRANRIENCSGWDATTYTKHRLYIGKSTNGAASSGNRIFQFNRRGGALGSGIYDIYLNAAEAGRTNIELCNGVQNWNSNNATLALNTDSTSPAGSVVGEGGRTVWINDGWILLGEQGSDPAAPVANTARLYVRDNGAGKTQLVVRFPTGAIQVLSTEP